MMNYQDFLATKAIKALSDGVDIPLSDINPMLFEFQKAIVQWACKKGRSAIFADTGLGKTFMQIEWARLMGKRTLIIAPLAITQQTIHEAQKLNVDILYVRSSDALSPDHNIFITNYDMIDHFNPSKFEAVVLDESSILKNLTGKIRTKIINMFSKTPYRLACTATPAPNDISEIGNHAEFLGVMNRNDMMSTFFTYDSSGGGTSKSASWRLKGYAHDSFYRWLASWAMAVKTPSDIGFSDDGYLLPEINHTLILTDYDYTPEGMLPGFGVGSISAIDANKIRRETIDERIKDISDLVNQSDEQFVIWCKLNDEAEALAKAIPGSINVTGSMDNDEKARLIVGFSENKHRVIVTKTKIAGMGINWQNCHNMIFFGIDFSWESYYQAIRRIWRFGQEHQVNVWVVTTQHESSIYKTVQEKEKEAIAMTTKLIEASRKYSLEELKRGYHEEWKYAEDEQTGNGWRMMLGDSVQRIKEIEDNSIDLSVYSPPFADLFVYSASPLDVGNNSSVDDFLTHYGFIIRENLRITKPGRLCAVHIADSRALKSVDGFTGKKDLSGDVIAAYIKEGWHFKQRITIDKNPQAQAIRLKDHGLLFKTLKKDSADLTGGHADYLLIFRKPGENKVPIQPFQRGEVSSEDWISWAHPVWYDIKETNTLNERIARTDKDEKHMCPLQLDLIERVIKLWSNPDETVFSPFAGIGSEGYEALRWKRQFLGIELKPEYYKVACRNLTNAESINGKTLWDLLPDNEAVQS